MTRTHSRSRKSHKRGFSLIELLVALAILAVLLILFILLQGRNVQRAQDARRKADLNKLKVVFEDYYNDEGCYPPEVLLTQCGSASLAPYIQSIPCDPVTKQPYPYTKDSNCKWYAIYTTLQDDDPSAKQVGNTPYNYVQTNTDTTTSSGTPGPTSAPTAAPSAGPTATPGPTPQQYACDPSGFCNVYEGQIEKGCPVTFTDPTACQQACSNPVNRCAQ
jgi:prepilin-type N-terminal cleavage/methylation domain-containing protein